MAHPEYLACAVKIIMHTNYMYTKDHTQRVHRPLLPAAPVAPVVPAIDTGVVLADLRVGMRVKVWWLDDWWFAKVYYISPRAGTVSVRFVGDRASTTRLLPRLMQIIG